MSLDHRLDHPRLLQTLFFPREQALPASDSGSTAHGPLLVDAGDARLACYRHAAIAAPPDRKPLTFVHFHGNGEVVADYLPEHARTLAELGVDVVMAEYRGYGASTGTPSLIGMLDDVDAIVRAIAQPAENLVVYGRSIGSIYAIELARRHPGIAGLIIESGISDVLERIDVRITAREIGMTREELLAEVAAHLDHRSKLAAYRGPLLVIHARDDHLVTVSHAENNHAWAGSDHKELVLFERGGHNAMLRVNWDEYVAAIRRFLDSVIERGAIAT